MPNDELAMAGGVAHESAREGRRGTAGSQLPRHVPFPGTYDPEDCLFLLERISPACVTTVAQKEAHIQGGGHYSEVVSEEHPPSPEYLELFLRLVQTHKRRLASEILALALEIAETRPSPVTLISLARAGTPIGALLRRALTRRVGRDSRHYSISIIRDRGIDENALRHILMDEGRPARGVVFVDGWTAKGVITRELERGIAAWNRRFPEHAVSDALYVVSDIGGTAAVAATYDDYVIPSGIMNATVSGLVSRSILNQEIGPNDFHGCVVYEHLRPHDRSRWFLDEITEQMEMLEPARMTPTLRRLRYDRAQACLHRLQERFGVSDINRVKPGIAEATRVMNRRVPDLLLLRDAHDPEVAHLEMLALEKEVSILTDPDMPFRAVALIRDVGRGSAGTHRSPQRSGFPQAIQGRFPVRTP